MKIAEVIKILKNMNQEEEIIASWWRQEDFKDICPLNLWESHVNIFENKIDWSGTKEEIEATIEWELNESFKKLTLEYKKELIKRRPL